uniref:Uncharacterized protein n=1 Tax=Branchiostoma floridae TaxID=7739 RepID=C3YYR2_BRAFL|eukprot:XP_002598408.1 hypothetical protein BRAFLDRAFT_83183 [Branchiostoma floridae]
MMNVTCLVNTWEETYQHVFTTPLSSTPDGTMCAEKTQATRTVSSAPDGTVCPREAMTLTTREPKIKTTKLTINQTNPRTNGTVEEKSPRVAIITMVVVVGVVHVALFVTYIIRRQRSCSCISRGPPLGVAALDRWGLPDSHSVTANNSHVTGVQGTATDTHSTSSSADEHSYEVVDEDDYNYYNTRPGARHPYWEIPDDHFNYYNTRPEAQHSYGEIPDEHYNYENTRPLSYPLTLRVPEDDEDDAVTFYAAAAEMVLPSSTRLGGKHPSYDTAPRVTEYHQGMTKKRLYGTAPRIRTHTRIPACEKNRNIGSYVMPTAGRYKAMDLALVGKYGRKQGCSMSREQGALYDNPTACARRQQANTQGHYRTTMAYDIFYQNNNNNNNNGDCDNSTLPTVLRKTRLYCQSDGRCPRDGNPKYDDDDLPFRTARFTTLGARGRLGPTTLGDYYRGQDHEDMVYLRDGVQVFTVPATGVYLLEVAGRLLKILIGQEGAENEESHGVGGGGGTFVTGIDNTPLIIAGGGGGGNRQETRNSQCDGTGSPDGNSGYSPKGGTSFTGGVKGHGATEGDRDNVGGGGGGLLSRGASSKYFGGKDGAYGGEGGESYIKGCVGGKPYVNGAEGGFGGGGGSFGNGGGGGGGGGYSGGGRGDNWSDACGGGGGSFSAGNETVATDGGNDGPGYVVITKL